MIYEEIREKLSTFYFTELPSCVDRLRERVFSIMDEYAKDNPMQSSYQLKAKLYQSLASEIAPKIFADIPFYFETGALIAHSDGKYNRGAIHANGWLYIRNEHLFIDSNPENYELYTSDAWRGLYSQTGTYVDIMHFGIPMEKLVCIGLKGVVAELNDALAAAQTEEVRQFLECALAGINALRTIELKFAEQAEAMGLMELSDIASRIPWEAPKTFHEGLCMMAFMRKALGSLEGVGFNSFGRPDVYLAPLYEADLQKGVCEEELLDLVSKFLLIWDCTLDRRNKLVGGYEYEKENTLTLGGCDENGEPVFNGVTRLFIQARNALETVYPKMMLRYSANSPKEYIELISAPLLRGQSFSVFENDDAIIPALVKSGVAKEDAINYTIGGCWDAIMPDVSIKYSGEYFNILRPLELLIERDYEFFDERGLDGRSFEDTEDFEDLYQKYIGYLRVLLMRMATAVSIGARFWEKVNPLCALSALTKVCIQKGKDVTAGGGRYTQECKYFSYIADLVDSFMAIKALCFDKKICTISRLFEECRTNWKTEFLRQMAINAPSYGDGSEETSRFVGRLLEDLYKISQELPTAYFGKYRVGSNQYTEVIWDGKKTKATPNGRKDGDYLGMGLSPSRYQKPVSVTEILDGMRYIDLTNYAGNTSLTVTLPAGKMDRERMTEFFYATASYGVQALQINCVDKETLLKAQKEPENYGHIIVRVCGFSAPFVLLSEEYQNEFITRLSME